MQAVSRLEFEARTGAGFEEDLHPRDARGRFTSGEVSIPDKLRKFAEHIGDLVNPSQVLGGLEFVPTQEVSDYLAANHAERFTSQPLPKGISKGPMGDCFKNATDLAMKDPRLTYCEGYAKSHDGMGFVYLHAWTCDKDGNVVDPTWSHSELNEYYGVRYPTPDVIRFAAKTGFYGVLGGDETEAVKVIRRGHL